MTATAAHRFDPTLAPIEIDDPGLGVIISSVGRSSIAACLDALGTASAASHAWQATSPRARADVLRGAFDLLIAEREAVARTIVRESGKLLADARAEVAYAGEFLRWYAEEAVRLPGDHRLAPGGGHDVVVTREPVGVALLVTPWNFPLAMVARKVAPALAAGCTALLKPAAETPLSALLLVDLLHRAGLPDGVVQVITPDPPAEAIAALLADGRVRKLSFTGSTSVGRHLLGLAAAHVVRCSMELGGAAPFIVLDDADLDTAVEGALVAKLRNSGAACTAANAFFVHHRVVDAFTDRLTTAMAGLRPGHGFDPEAGIGALISQAQQHRIGRLVEDEVARGAVVRTGGRAPDGAGWFYEPTVLADVAPTSPLLIEEIFGPVAPIATVGDEDEAIALANRSSFGLAAYVFSGNTRRAMAVGRGLEVGMVGINRGLVSEVSAPFGGVKESGIGREGGSDGILEYCESKYLAVGD